MYGRKMARPVPEPSFKDEAGIRDFLLGPLATIKAQWRGFRPVFMTQCL
jgi:hypothetical protein